MVAAAHDVADGDEGQGEHFASEIGADLTRLDEVGFFPFAQNIFAFIFIISAHTGNDDVGRDFFRARTAFAHRFGQRELGEPPKKWALRAVCSRIIPW